MKSKFKIEKVFTDLHAFDKKDDSMLVTYNLSLDKISAIPINEKDHLSFYKNDSEENRVRVGVWRKVSNQRAYQLASQKTAREAFIALKKNPSWNDYRTI